MADPTRPRPAGWYQDPDDPTCVRHRDSQGWTDRRRNRPGWDLPDTDWVAPPLPSDTGGPVLEGPVRSPGLPAIAAAASGRPRNASPRRRMVTSSASSTAGGGAARFSPAPSIQPWNAGRRPIIVVVGVTVVAVLAMAMSVAFTRPAHAIPWTMEDPQFLTDANKVCATSLPGARPSAAPAMTSGTAAPSPIVLMRWASTVDGVAGQIRYLPSAPYDVGRLNTWLGEWQTYSLDEIRYANGLRTDSKPLTPAQAKASSAITAALSQEAGDADRFAAGNGLGDCTLGPAPRVVAPTQ